MPTRDFKFNGNVFFLFYKSRLLRFPLNLNVNSLFWTKSLKRYTHRPIHIFNKQYHIQIYSKRINIIGNAWFWTHRAYKRNVEILWRERFYALKFIYLYLLHRNVTRDVRIACSTCIQNTRLSRTVRDVPLKPIAWRCSNSTSHCTCVHTWWVLACYITITSVAFGFL